MWTINIKTNLRKLVGQGQTVNATEQKEFEYLVQELWFCKSDFQISISSRSVKNEVTEKTKISLERKFCILQTLDWL